MQLCNRILVLEQCSRGTVLPSADSVFVQSVPAHCTHASLGSGVRALCCNLQRDAVPDSPAECHVRPDLCLAHCVPLESIPAGPVHCDKQQSVRELRRDVHAIDSIPVLPSNSNHRPCMRDDHHMQRRTVPACRPHADVKSTLLTHQCLQFDAIPTFSVIDNDRQDMFGLHSQLQCDPVPAHPAVQYNRPAVCC